MADSSLWVNEGGVLKSPPLSEFLRYTAQPQLKFRRFVDTKDALGKNQGDTFNFDKVANIAAPGGQLTETSTVPLSSQSVTKGTLTVNEYGHGISYTGKIQTLSKFDIESIIERGLVDDNVKVTDAAVHAQFNACKLHYVGTATDGKALTTDGTATATNTSVLNEYHIRTMKLELEKRNVPTLEGDTYVMLAALEAVNGLQGAMVSVNQYTEQGYRKIMNGEIGMINNVRVIKDNNATRLAYTLATPNTATTSKTWAGVGGGEGFMFGRDTVMEAMVVPDEIRMKESTDFGRSQGLAWYFLGGWKLIWDDEPNARIIKWASAA